MSRSATRSSSAVMRPEGQKSPKLSAATSIRSGATPPASWVSNFWLYSPHGVISSVISTGSALAAASKLGVMNPPHQCDARTTVGSCIAAPSPAGAATGIPSTHPAAKTPAAPATRELRSKSRRLMRFCCVIGSLLFPAHGPVSLENVHAKSIDSARFVFVSHRRIGITPYNDSQRRQKLAVNAQPRSHGSELFQIRQIFCMIAGE